MRRSLVLVLVTLSATIPAPLAQDREYIQAIERVQQARPARLSPVGRIAPVGEPGTPLVIHGRLFAADGRTPLPNAVVFAYHTDSEGLYDVPGSPPHSWRLRGWAAADADGRFEFRTIRPGGYPGGRVPAHVHFTAFTPSGERYHAGELQFADDRAVPQSARAEAERLGASGAVQPVRTEAGTQHVDVQLRTDPKERF